MYNILRNDYSHFLSYQLDLIYKLYGIDKFLKELSRLQPSILIWDACIDFDDELRYE